MIPKDVGYPSPGEHRGDSPLVSVVLIFFNGAGFIQEAIDSVFSQTYSNWELILVDDGSTDSSTNLARQCADSHSDKIRYFEHPGHRNLGAATSRNFGIRNAKGEVFAFLDSDDVWLSHKLERQVSILQGHPRAGMVFGASEYWRSWKSSEGGAEADSIPDLGLPTEALYEPPELLLRLHPLAEGAAPCPSDLLIRRDAFDRSGGFQEEFRGVYQLYEDQAFLTKVYLREPVYVSNENWTRYRIHPASCMSTVAAAGRELEVRLFFLTYLDRYLSAQCVGELRIWSLLRKALRPFGRSVSLDGLDCADKRELEWQLRLANGNDARFDCPLEDPELLRITGARIKTKDPWDIQINRPDLCVKAGASYRLVFNARAAANRAINVGFSRAYDPWDTLGLYQSLGVTEEWVTHNLDFVAADDDRNGRIHFDLGGNENAVELSGVALYDVSEGTIVEPDSIVLGHYPAARWSEAAGEAGTHGAAGEHPRFSVVIPTYQRRELVLRSVLAFERQEYDGWFEVIVAVDGSNDGSAEALRALTLPFPLTVLDQPNRGAAAARNNGASVAAGDTLLFIDDDMEAHPMLLAEHARSFASGAEVVLGHFPLHPKSPKGFLSAGVGAWVQRRARKLSQPGYELPYEELLSGQISLPRETFLKMSGFDTDLTAHGTYGNEDLEFAYRLIASGRKAVFNPYALTYQNYVVTPRERLRQARQTGHASVTFARKHPEHTAVIFAPEPGRSTSVALWRSFAALRPLTAPIAAALRTFALALVERGFEGPKAVRFFYEICQMEFRLGVQEAGGMPRVPSVRVLAYHAIRDLAGAPVVEPYGTPPAQFAAHLKLLKRAGFHFIGLDQFLAFLFHGERLPPRPVLVTFDDCYDDLLETALPILKRFGITAAAFAVSGCLGDTNTWDVKSGAPLLPLLDATGLKRLQAHGIQVGGHSRSHRLLTEVSEQELDGEIRGCLQELEARGLGRPRIWSYPYGESNARVRRAVRDAGIEAAFTVDGGRVFKNCDPFQVPRIEILRGDTGWKFLWKMISAA